MKQNYFIIAILTILTILKPAHASENIAVVEFFTTESACSDHPEANKNFEKYAQLNHTNLIAISCHLSSYTETKYDNAIAHPFCEDRLDSYQDDFDILNDSIPQVIFNGTYTAIGQKDDIFQSGIALAHSEDTVQRIHIDTDTQSLQVTLPKTRLMKPVDIWIFGYRKSVTQTIDLLQNDTLPSLNKPMHFSNVLTQAQKIMQWDGRYINFSFPLSIMKTDGYVIIAQEPLPSAIIAAGKMEP